jgi:hypothetical protein
MMMLLSATQMQRRRRELATMRPGAVIRRYARVAGVDGGVADADASAGVPKGTTATQVVVAAGRQQLDAFLSHHRD